MRQKGKKRRRYYILLMAFVFVVMAGSMFGASVYYMKKMHTGYHIALKEQDNLIQQNTRQVYVAVREIKRGEIIEEEMVELRRTLCSQSEELLFSQQDIGKEAVTDVVEGTFLNKSLVNQSGQVDGLREMCYRTIDLTENVDSYDVVDIRIRYPDGEDYIVLSGKQILIDEDGYGKCYLKVSEEELLLMSAALVDTEQNDGTRIYTSRYPEPAIQQKSYITYCPPKEILDLMEQSPNIRLKNVGEE